MSKDAWCVFVQIPSAHGIKLTMAMGNYNPSTGGWGWRQD